MTELCFKMPGQPLLLHLIKSYQRWEPRVKDYPDLKVLSSPPPPGRRAEIYIFKVIMHQIVLEIIQLGNLQERQRSTLIAIPL